MHTCTSRHLTACTVGEQLELCPGLTVLRIGGHFAGSSVLAWQPGSEGRGSLFTGDTVQIVQDRRSALPCIPTLDSSVCLLRHCRKVTPDDACAKAQPWELTELRPGWCGRYLSFMWSYPNYIPLPAEQVATPAC